MKKIILFTLLCTVLSCKGQTESKEITSNNDEVLQSLPDDIADKIWIFIHDDPESIKYNTYKKIIDYDKKDGFIKTEKNILHTIRNITESYNLPIKFDTVIYKNGEYNISFGNNREIEFAKFKWVEKKKGIGEWKIRYLRFRDGIPSTITYRCVDKTYVTPENFPETEETKKPEESKLVLEKEKTIDVTIYGDKILKKLPVKGWFYCEDSKLKDNYEVGLNFIEKEQIISNEDGSVLKKLPSRLEVDLNDALRIVCSLRKIKGSPNNKYALFYEYRIRKCMTLYIDIPKESEFYSKNQPIAEVEILDDNTVKRKWIGFYNRDTKKIEDYAQKYGWEEGCNNILKRIKDGSLVNSAL